MNKFKHWIEGQGVAALALRLGVKRSSVYRWAKGETRPKLANVQRILKMAKGALTLADIVGAG